MCPQPHSVTCLVFSYSHWNLRDIKSLAVKDTVLHFKQQSVLECRPRCPCVLLCGAWTDWCCMKKKIIFRLPSTISLQQAQSAEPSTIKALSDCKPYRLPLRLKQPGMKHERPAYRVRETELHLWEWLWAEGALSEITFSFENLDLNKRLEEKVQKWFQVGMKAMLGRLKKGRWETNNLIILAQKQGYI